jgi:hypothetical protein
MTKPLLSDVYREKVPEHCVKVVNFGRHYTGLSAVGEFAIANDPVTQGLQRVIAAQDLTIKQLREQLCQSQETK